MPLVDKDMLVGVINLSGEVKNVVFADSDYEFVSSVSSSLAQRSKLARERSSKSKTATLEKRSKNVLRHWLRRTATLPA